jgi:hypothetical protein
MRISIAEFCSISCFLAQNSKLENMLKEYNASCKIRLRKCHEHRIIVLSAL